jgi:tryptophanyl-tRNA synthetase
MSKSVGNTILLADSAADIMSRVMTAYTDPLKVRADSPGRPEAHPPDHPGCVVWEYHRKFNAAEAEDIAARCRAGKLGCVADKKYLAQKLADVLAPVRERRAQILADPDFVRDVLADGTRRARAVAVDTMERVRSAMGLKSTLERVP